MKPEEVIRLAGSIRGEVWATSDFDAAACTAASALVPDSDDPLGVDGRTDAWHDVVFAFREGAMSARRGLKPSCNLGWATLEPWGPNQRKLVAYARGYLWAGERMVTAARGEAPA